MENSLSKVFYCLTLQVVFQLSLANVLRLTLIIDIKTKNIYFPNFSLNSLSNPPLLRRKSNLISSRTKFQQQQKGSSWLNVGCNFPNSKYIIQLKRKNKIFVQIFFILYLNNFWVPIKKKPPPSDHESDDENSYLRLTNLIPKKHINS